jgi:hypothetical protein
MEHRWATPAEAGPTQAPGRSIVRTAVPAAADVPSSAEVGACTTPGDPLVACDSAVEHTGFERESAACEGWEAESHPAGGCG